MKTFGVIVLGVILLAGTVFGLNGLGYINYKFWAPKYEDARREVFENTKSYQHGTIRDVRNMILAYYEADTDAHKNAIKQTLRHRIAAFDEQDLPSDIRKFLREVN